MASVTSTRDRAAASPRRPRLHVTQALPVVGLVGAIAVADLVANGWTPEAAQIPVKLAIAAGFIAWASGSIGLSWSELGLDPTRLYAGLRFGAGAVLIVAAAIATFVVFPGASAMLGTNAVASASPVEQVLTPLLIIPIGTVVFEEIIFRGVFLGAALRVASPRTAAIATSAVFGLWHILPALHSASGSAPVRLIGVMAGTVIVTTIAGLAFTWLRLRSGSLLAPMLAHIATNSLAYVGALIVLR